MVQKIIALQRIRGIGPNFAAVLVREVLYRSFANRRQLASYVGITPSLREKLIKISAKVVSHGRYVTFQMAEVAVPRHMFQHILSLIARLRSLPAPA